MAETTWVEDRAAELFALHRLNGWEFGWDNAKTRFGQCSHRDRRITLSRHLSAPASHDDVEQVLLHEIAHALVGSREGHGPQWRTMAASLGYRGGRTHAAPAATDTAKWAGHCPAGHEVIRFRKPSRPMSCAKCKPTFSRDHLIAWSERLYSSTTTSFQNTT